MDGGTNGTNYLTNFRFAQYCQALNKIFDSGKRVLSTGLNFLEIGPAVHEGEVICHVFVMSCCRSVTGTIWVACLSGGGSGGGAAEALQTGGWLEATAPDTNITLLQCCSRRCSCTQPAPPPPTRHVWPAEVKKPLSVITSGLTFLFL